MGFIRRPLPRASSVLDYPAIHQYLAILSSSRLQIIAIPSNPPFCRLLSSYTVKEQDRS